MTESDAASRGEDNWRDLPLESGQLKPFRQTLWGWSVLELLQDHGLKTVGDISDLSRADVSQLSNIDEHHVDAVVGLIDQIVSLQRGVHLGGCFDEGDGREGAIAHSPHEDSYLAQSLVDPGPGLSPAPGPRAAIEAGRNVGIEFVGLRQIAAFKLGDPVLRAVWDQPGDELAHEWLSRTGAETVGELLPLTRQDFLDQRGMGPTKVRRLFEYLRRLEAAAPAVAAAGAFAFDPGSQPVQTDSGKHLEALVAWGTEVVGAATWGDLLDATAESMPADVAEAWRALRETDLPSAPSVHGLRAFLAEDPRRARVLVGRLASSEPLTLQELATEFGVTRERVRQVELKATEHLRSMVAGSPHWRTERWSAERLAVQAGAYAPGEILKRALPTWDRSERAIIARLAGYSQSDPVLVRDGIRIPSAAELPTLVGTDFVVEEYEAVEHLTGLGVLAEHIDFVLDSIEGVTRVDGQLVRWGGSVVDKAVAVLEVRDEPQDIDELVSIAYGEGRSRSARQRIFDDPRTLRVSKSKFGLRRWGGTQYRGVAEQMLERLASGPMDLDELAAELAERYEIAPASVRMYAGAPAFKVTGDTIALRSRKDPYVPRNAPWRARGLYRLSRERAIVWSVEADHDMLRGSGRSVPQEIAADLGVAPGDRTELDSAVGPITLVWSELTHSGPQLGSVRALLERAGIVLGDRAVFRFDIARRTVEVSTAISGGSQRGVEGLVDLTGLPRDVVSEQSALAAAVGVDPADLVSALEARGDADAASLVAHLAHGSGNSAARSW